MLTWHHFISVYTTARTSSWAASESLTLFVFHQFLFVYLLCNFKMQKCHKQVKQIYFSAEDFNIRSFCTLPDTSSRLMMLFISCVEMMTSSNTGTLPPTSPVLPPCGTTARPRSWQYLTMADTSSVVLGRSKILLDPETCNNTMRACVHTSRTRHLRASHESANYTTLNISIQSVYFSIRKFVLR